MGVKQMPSGLVYILTNPCLDGWVKIGMTERDDIERRLQELNAPANIPLSYRCYATYEVEEPREVERRIHSIIDRVDGTLHAREALENGRIREREFFRLSPEAAYGILRDIAELRGDADRLRLHAPTAAQAREEELSGYRQRRLNNSFGLLGIEPGEEIVFLYDEDLTARVVNRKNRVEFEGQVYSVTGLASRLLRERCGWAENASLNGWRYFTRDGLTLSELRRQIEDEGE